MGEFKQKFATSVAITVTGGATGADLDDLYSTATCTSSAVDNSTNKYAEILLEIKVGGTAISTSWCEVRILGSTDGGSTYDTWNGAIIILPTIDMTADNPVYHARFVPPQYWKLAVKNNTGAALDVGSAAYQGVTYSDV